MAWQFVRYFILCFQSAEFHFHLLDKGRVFWVAVNVFYFRGVFFEVEELPLLTAGNVLSVEANQLEAPIEYTFVTAGWARIQPDRSIS